MAYEIHPGAPLGDSLRRAAAEQAREGVMALQAAIEVRASTPDPNGRDEDAWDGGIHEARKRGKKVRAVARLCRDALQGGYRPANLAFRDAARLIAEPRDAWALVETADLLAERDGGNLLSEEIVADLRGRLVTRHRGVRASVIQEGRDHQALAALTTAFEQIGDWPLPEDLTAADLLPSVVRVHRRGRDLLHAVQSTTNDPPHTTTERWHEWRKRAKYLRYQVDLLGPAWPAILDSWEQALHNLTDCIGDDHDLAVLVQTLTNEDLVPTAVAARVTEAAAVVRSGRRDQALDLGRRLYAEQSPAFADRIVCYVDTCLRSDQHQSA